MKFNVLPEFARRKTTCPACKESLVVPAPDATVVAVVAEKPTRVVGRKFDRITRVEDDELSCSI